MNDEIRMPLLRLSEQYHQEIEQILVQIRHFES